MSGNSCRICSGIINEKDPINLFENQNKIILHQIKDLTGIRLKNNSALPKFMCCLCKKDLKDAYTFREKFLKVQESFRVKVSRRNKKKTNDDIVEATEFVQVFVVKEEPSITIDSQGNTYKEDEEKEINILGSEDFNKKQNLPKEFRNEVNALELKPNEENTLDDTKIAIEVIGDKIDVAFENSKNSSEDEDLNYKSSGEEYNQQTEIVKAKKSIGIRKVTKSRRKRNDAADHPNIFICDQCGNHFNCRHHFKLHLRRHTGDKRCACELCSDKFFTSSELRRHMRRHTGERPFACKYCDRRFTDYSTRIKHERTHTNERPFMCSQCGKSFTTSYILKNHMLTHTGERHFKCEVCNKAFTRRTHLIVHFRSIMHKQALEKQKCPTFQEDLSQSNGLIQQSADTDSFIL